MNDFTKITKITNFRNNSKTAQFYSGDRRVFLEYIRVCVSDVMLVLTLSTNKTVHWAIAFFLQTPTAVLLKFPKASQRQIFDHALSAAKALARDFSNAFAAAEFDQRLA